PFGSLLLMRAGISWRLGVRGYAGGCTAAQQWVDFDAREHVGRSALRFAELLGASDLPENRPQIFLESPPVENGAIVVAPGGGVSPAVPHLARPLFSGFAPARCPVGLPGDARAWSQRDSSSCLDAR